MRPRGRARHRHDGQGAPIWLVQKQALRWFESLPWPARERVDFSTVRGTQFLEPLFEFSGACAGCGETPISSC